VLYVNPYAADPTLLNGTVSDRERETVALEQFERQFLRELMKTMRRMVPSGELFPDSQQKQLFNEMLDDHFAGAMAKSGQLGIAKNIQAQLDARRPDPEAPAISDEGLPIASQKQAVSLYQEQEALPLARERTPLPMALDTGKEFLALGR